MKRPAVGQTITVTVKHFSNCLPALFPNEPKAMTFTGKVVPNDQLDPKDSFCMTTDNPEFPIRNIALRNIISFNGASVARDDTPQPKTVTVKGSKGDDYTVTFFPDGRAACTCAGFSFRKRCSHIDKARG